MHDFCTAEYWLKRVVPAKLFKSVDLRVAVAETLCKYKAIIRTEGSYKRKRRKVT